MKGGFSALAGVVVVAAVAAGAWWGAQRVDLVLTRPEILRADYPVTVEIPHGASAGAVARELEHWRIVRDARVLRGWLQATGQSQRIQAGEYAFDRGVSVIEAADKLVSGDVVLHAVTVPEGLTLDETALRMAASGLWTADGLAAAFRDPSPVHDLDPDATDLEGYLFPDTYHFPKGEPPQAVARTMVNRFRAAWAEARGDDLRGQRTVRQVAALAAIVEKETGVPSEHALVAGVYANRLAKGMRLEADPTVITALQHAGLWTGGPLLLRDLQYDSPYNTYLHEGLPPGPIASFGLPSLEAALRPAQTDALYFVATGTGGHRFAATLKEHEKNVALYRETLKAAAPATASP